MNIDTAKIGAKNLIGLLIGLVLFHVGHAQEDETQALDTLFGDYVKEEKFNGNVLIAYGDSILYQKSFGCSNCKDYKELNQDTPFYIASVAKSITSIAILQLAERGLLRLDDTIDRYFPDLPPWSNQVTIRNLLNHTSGIPDYIRSGWYKEDYQNADIYQEIRNVKILNFRPGTKFRYSNSGYILLASIIEISTGNYYDQYILENIFIPAGMSNSWVHSHQYRRLTQTRPRAIGYRANLKREDDYQLNTYGDGGIFSTVVDLHKLDIALANNLLLNEETFMDCTQETVLKNGTEKSYGLGWFLGLNTNGKYIYHTGSLNGFRAYYERHLDLGRTIVILNNSSFNGLEKIRNEIVNRLEE